MFPIRDHNPSLRTPYVTYALILANILVFAASWPYFANDAALAGFFNDWAMIPARVVNGEYRYTLWIFGDNLEDALGHVGFLLFYLASGIGADVAQLMADPTSPIPTVGASGAIAGVMGGYLLLFPKARVDVLIIFIVFFRVFAVPAWLVLAFWFGIQIFSGIGSDISSGGVAYWAHAGGFVIGLVLVLPHWLRRGGPGLWQRTHGRPPHPEADYSASRIPVIRRRR
jgi:membrane associated rhomboid family serine protease